MTDRQPLTPPECDLRDFRSMMIDIPRLRGSEFDATPDDAAWRAGLNLWMTAFHSVPAAALDDNEGSLCKAAGLGRDLKTWRKVRVAAMRGFVLCTDGRWYHETVAEVALEAWLGKLAQQMSSGAGNAKRWGGSFDPDQIRASIRVSAALLSGLNPASKALQKASRYISGSDPGGNENLSRQDAQTVPSGSQVEGKGKGEEKEQDSDSRGERPSLAGYELEENPDFLEFFQAFPKKEGVKSAAKAYAAARGNGTTHVDLLGGAMRYATYIKATKQEMRFVMMAKTWIAEEGWKDQYGVLGEAAPAIKIDPSWGEERVAKWKAALGGTIFDAWFANAEIVDSCDPPLLRFPRPFQKNWVANHYTRQVRNLLGGEFQLGVRT